MSRRSTGDRENYWTLNPELVDIVLLWHPRARSGGDVPLASWKEQRP